jgi:hypothetical protein
LFALYTFSLKKNLNFFGALCHFFFHLPQAKKEVVEQTYFLSVARDRKGPIKQKVLSMVEKMQVEGQTYCEVFSLFNESFILSPSTTF